MRELEELHFSVSEANVDRWNGYYALIAIDEEVNTVLTIDDGFERFDAIKTEAILPSDEFAESNGFLESESRCFFRIAAFNTFY